MTYNILVTGGGGGVLSCRASCRRPPMGDECRGILPTSRDRLPHRIWVLLAPRACARGSIGCPEDIMNKEAERWLRRAEADLKAAGDSLKDKNFEWCCFQSQQSAEKALKWAKKPCASSIAMSPRMPFDWVRYVLIDIYHTPWGGETHFENVIHVINSIPKLY
jgi:hypothetical protein